MLQLICSHVSDNYIRRSYKGAPHVVLEKLSVSFDDDVRGCCDFGNNVTAEILGHYFVGVDLTPVIAMAALGRD